MLEGVHILLVEDDEKLGLQVASQLQEQGYGVRRVTRGDDALALDPGPFALIVLDLMLPGAHGLDVLKAYRERVDVPILVLSAKQDAHVKVRALELGADDYVSKPFWPEELAARIGARLRRPAMVRGDAVEVGRLQLDQGTRRARVAGEEIELTRVEFDLLLTLAQRPGAAVERNWLAERVLDPEREGTARTLDVHVSRLRKKLGPCAGYLRTVWGVGYRLEAVDG